MKQTDQKPLPTLELAMRVAQMGGWDRVELLTHDIGSDEDSEIRWMHPKGGHKYYYMDPEEAGPGWVVYDVRARGTGGCRWTVNRSLCSRC